MADSIFARQCDSKEQHILCIFMARGFICNSTQASPCIAGYNLNLYTLGDMVADFFSRQTGKDTRMIEKEGKV